MVPSTTGSISIFVAIKLANRDLLRDQLCRQLQATTPRSIRPSVERHFQSRITADSTKAFSTGAIATTLFFIRIVEFCCDKRSASNRLPFALSRPAAANRRRRAKKWPFRFRLTIRKRYLALYCHSDSVRIFPNDKG